MQKNRTLYCPSLTKMDGSLDLVPGRLKAAHCSWGSWRKDSPGWENAEEKFTATSACVSCVATLNACVCCVSFVPNKLTLTFDFGGDRSLPSIERVVQADEQGVEAPTGGCDTDMDWLRG